MQQPSDDTKENAVPEAKPLAGKRILIPPARPEVNPLLRMLERKGADVLAFPALRVAPPADYSSLDKAIENLKDFHWIVFSGSNCAQNFLARLSALGLSKEAMSGSRIAAIGHGAYSSLKKAEIDVDYIPKVHTAQGVIEGLGEISGLNFLLIRVEGASSNLPERLRSLGGQVTEIAGYRMLVEASPEQAEKAFNWRPDVLALANPTAVRFLLKATERLRPDLQTRLRGVTIAAVGPVTAEAARALLRNPDIVSKGHIADLVQTLTELLSR